jgi:colicin import membrane protein
MGMAIFAHLLLVAALTWGVNWKRQTTTVTAEAELWSSIPQQAAPRAVAPPPPPPPPKPEPKPEPTPAPAPPPVDKAPDIVDKQDKPPKKPVEKPAEKPPEPKAKPEAKPDPAALKKEAQKKAEEEVAQREKDREENLKRITGLAGATGGPTATGNAQQSSGAGISKNYGDRIANAVRPNIVFTGDAPPNARVELDIQLAPDGTILGRPRITKSSGYKEFDEAVVRGFEKTEVLPRAEDGRVPPNLPIGWTRRNTN